LLKKLLPVIQTSKTYEYLGLCDFALKDYTNALMDFDKAILLSNEDEYLEARYNEIKEILEGNQNETKVSE
jgi:tetratricopeptide (TPR) repeat protein